MDKKILPVQQSLALTNQVNTIAKQLNDQVLSVVGQEAITGFEKAFLIATAVGFLREKLTDEYMQPIMNLQGNKLGFRTDKDREGGYGIKVVRECVIEAVLNGLQPYGNQFNIIGGNCYYTKEGLGCMLKNLSTKFGLRYDIVPELPRIKDQSGAVVMNLSWSIGGGELQTKKIDFPIRVNSGMGTDAVIGKATRKARAWLYAHITGNEISEGDVTDLDARPARTTITVDAAQKENDRLLHLIKDATTVDDLMTLKEHLKTDEQIEQYENKLQSLIQN